MSDIIQGKINGAVLLNSNRHPLSFLRTELEFTETNLENKFSSLRSRTLADTLLSKKYSRLTAEVEEKYAESLRKSLPGFLSTLKQSADPFYKRFLNPHGDNRFCKFKMVDNDVGGSKGMYLYLVGTRILYVGITVDSFYKRINAGYGNISPKNCYLDGQATNCHLNSLINDSDHAILSLWICSLRDVKGLEGIERFLIKTLKPLWNLALKPKVTTDTLYFTHCSKAKNPDFEDTMDATTPDVLYTSNRIKSFFDDVKERDVPWAIFSDKYGFVFSSSLLRWYDLSPDAISKEDLRRFLEESIDELRGYRKIIYRAGKKPIHWTYQDLIDAMKCFGLIVEVQEG